MGNNKVSEKAVWEGSISPDNDTPSIGSQMQAQPQMMFCYKCNNVIPGNSTFCPYCQIKLFTECPKCGTKYSSQYPACNQCGTNREEYLRVQKIGQVPHSPKKEINGHEYIDLGLPSGLKWATCNVGANKPEEFGDFFAWGENYTKNEYTSDNCKTIKKKLLGSIIERNGIFMDAPSSIWGRPWRMPTKTDILELLINCTWAWTIKNGTKAPQAAGKIHTDFERGFIRAEVIAFEDLKALGTMANAKAQGKVRSEGKEYVMKDGDIVNFLFNV